MGSQRRDLSPDFLTGLRSHFLNSQDYLERPCVKNKTKRTNRKINPPNRPKLNKKQGIYFLFLVFPYTSLHKVKIGSEEMNLHEVGGEGV